ncbi:MAG: DUF2917 domain-containing protein [Fimbriimonas sp.]
MKKSSMPLLEGCEILRMDSRHDHVLRVLEGTVYVTTEGDAADHFLAGGEELTVDAHRLTLVQAWPKARVEVL